MPHRIEGIQIFKVGRWNGDEYSPEDLDDMIANFDRVGFAVPLVIGHDNKSDAPAYGWVSKIWRTGKTLFADLRDVSESVYKLIKDRGYDHVSAEIFWNLERNGKKFRRVLKAIALLGAATPAVSGLAPLRTSVNAIGGTSRRYSIDDVCGPYGCFGHLDDTDFVDDSQETTTMSTANDAAGEALVRLCQALQAKNPGMSDREIFERVRASPEGQRLVRQYGEAAVYRF